MERVRLSILCYSYRQLTAAAGSNVIFFTFSIFFLLLLRDYFFLFLYIPSFFFCLPERSLVRWVDDEPAIVFVLYCLTHPLQGGEQGHGWRNKVGGGRQSSQRPDRLQFNEWAHDVKKRQFGVQAQTNAVFFRP